MGMPEIQEAPRPSNPWVPMGATVVETGTDALGSLGNRSQGIAFMNGSWMSREVHVQFWERVGVKFACATHLILGLMVHRYLVMFAAFFKKPEPAPAPIFVKIRNLHTEDSRNPCKRKKHDADQGPVPQTLQRIGRNGS